jgi:excisionase family DNA binding protein
MTTEPLLYTAEQAAERLGVGLTTTKALIKSGELRSVKILRCRRVPAEALREYVQRLDAEQNGQGGGTLNSACPDD